MHTHKTRIQIRSTEKPADFLVKTLLHQKSSYSLLAYSMQISIGKKNLKKHPSCEGDSHN